METNFKIFKLLAMVTMKKMKRSPTFLTFLALISISNSQILVEYDFDSSISPSVLDSQVVSSQFLGQANFNSFPSHIPPSFGWEDQSFDVAGSQYSYGYFTLAPLDPLNYSLTLASLHFDVVIHSSSVNTGLEIYTSVDSFNTPIFVQPAQPSGSLLGTYFIDLTPFIPANLITATTFRIVPFNSIYSDSTSLHIDNVSVLGTVNVIPEIKSAHLMLLIMISITFIKLRSFMTKRARLNFS